MDDEDSGMDFGQNDREKKRQDMLAMIDQGLIGNRDSNVLPDDSMDDARSVLESLGGDVRGTTEEDELIK